MNTTPSLDTAPALERLGPPRLMYGNTLLDAKAVLEEIVDLLEAEPARLGIQEIAPTQLAAHTAA